MSNIESDRLKIVKADASHITPTYLSWLNDKTLMRFSRQRHFTHSYQSSLDYQKSFELTKNHLWAILDRVNGDLYGTISAYIDDRAQVADIGIMVGNPVAAGKGIGKEAWGLVMRYLFEQERMRKLTAGTVKGNVAMEKIAAHWQMQLEGTLRGQELIENVPYDILRYGILKDEWQLGKSGRR